VTTRQWWREEEATPDPAVPPRLPGEAFFAYVERIAVAQGWMQPIRGKGPRREVGPGRIPGEDDE
jgi:hypothetical protein